MCSITSAAEEAIAVKLSGRMDIAELCKVESGKKQVGEEGKEHSSQARRLSDLEAVKQRMVRIVKKSPSLSPPPASRSTITIRLWVSYM